MADQLIAVTGKGGFDCFVNDKHKDDFPGARFDKKFGQYGAWMIPAKYATKLTKLIDSGDYDIAIADDMAPAANIDPDGDPTRPPAPPKAAPKAPASRSNLPATQKPAVIDYINYAPEGSKLVPRETSHGKILIQERSVRLDNTNTHVIQGKRTPSKDGYLLLAEAAGVVIEKPPYLDDAAVLADGTKRRENPYIVRDKRGVIIRGEIRYKAARYGSDGTIQIVDRTVELNMVTSLIQSLWDKIKDKPEIGKSMSLASFKRQIETNPNMADWVCMIEQEGTEDYETVVLAYDPGHKEIQDVRKGYAQIAKFIDRHLQTKGITHTLRNVPPIATPNLAEAFAESETDYVLRKVQCVLSPSGALEEIAEAIRRDEKIKEKNVVVDKKKIDISKEDIEDAEFEDDPDPDVIDSAPVGETKKEGDEDIDFF